MAKKKVNVTVDYKVKGAEDVEGAFDGVGDSAEDAAGAVDNLNKNTAKTKGSFDKAKQGAGGLLTSFKAIISNPVGLVITAVVGAVQALKSAFESNEEASNKLGQGWAYLKGLLKPLQKAFFAVFEAVTFAIEKPGEAWDAIVKKFDDGVKFLDKTVWAPLKAAFTLVVGGIESGILKMRIAWNEFTGDAEEAQALSDELKVLEAEMTEAALVIADGQKEVEEAIDGAIESIKEIVEEASKYADAMLELEKREQALTKARREQEIQNAKSLAQLESLKIIRDDESKSLEERIAANEKIAKIEANRVNQAVSLAQKELKLLQDRAKIEGEGTEILDSITEKEIELAELRNENAGIRAEQIVNDVALRVEAFEKSAGLIDQERELNAVLEEDAVKLADATVQAEIDKLARLEELGLEENQRYRDQQAALLLAQKQAEKARLDAKKEADEKEIEAQNEANAQAIDDAKETAKLKTDIQKELGSQLLNLSDSLVSALGEDSKTALAIQKATALGEIAVSTARAISSLVAASSANPANAVTFGAAGAAQFAAGVLQIGSNIAQAYALIKEPAPQITAEGTGGASAPSTAQTAPDLGFEGRTAGSEQFGAQVVRAYVTETDITTSQNTANNIQQLSQIG